MTEHLITKLPLPMKLETIILIKVKPCRAILCMLLIRISIYLKSVPRYKILILDTISRILYLREQGCEGPWLFFEAKSGPRAKKFGKHWLVLF